jgi:hypothetical protein
MKKHIQILVGVALAALVVFAIVSCSDNRSPVQPASGGFDLANYYMNGPSNAKLDGKVGVYITQPPSTCGNNGELVLEFDDSAEHSVAITFAGPPEWTYTYPPAGTSPDPLSGKGRHYFGTLCEHGEITRVQVDGMEVWSGEEVNEMYGKELTKDQAKPQSSASVPAP